MMIAIMIVDYHSWHSICVSLCDVSLSTFARVAASTLSQNTDEGLICSISLENVLTGSSIDAACAELSKESSILKWLNP